MTTLVMKLPIDLIREENDLILPGNTGDLFELICGIGEAIRISRIV